MKFIPRHIFIVLFQFFCFCAHTQTAPKLFYKNESFSLYSDRVEQGLFVGRVVSPNQLVSNYQSPANLFSNGLISFKFSINGQDNEMGFAINHQYLCTAAENETPVIVFGKQRKETSHTEPVFLKPKTGLTIKLDAREVLSSFEKSGYFITVTGFKIYKQDFKGFFVAGDAAPLTWDFDNLGSRNQFKLEDSDGDGVYTIRLVLNDPDAQKRVESKWELEKNISDFPTYQSSSSLADAIYNLSIEEMMRAIEPDSTFRTGKEWAGVWTRDISYSILLSMAYLQPKVAMISLLKKVNRKKRIIQDTGTGGAYPVSTDRIVWAIAAWEVFKATGDTNWLKQSYDIVRNSIEDDLQNVYDEKTGLVKGESSFLDWREQSYPRWMQPSDIFQSENLGTNALHYQANIVLADMAKLLGNTDAYTKYSRIADRIKKAINNHLWLGDKGYYAQYLYGRSFLKNSPRSEALGEALCVLFDIAEGSRRDSVVAQTPVMNFGVPCIYPQIPDIVPYHNNAIWPFVQSYFTLAAATAKNEEVVLHGIASVYRAAALFATNKENMVADNGDFAGTQVNSSNMLWSLSGSIALVHKVLFGIRLNTNQISFDPFVPKTLDDRRVLSGFAYRNAKLDIHLNGYGDGIDSFWLDGVYQKSASISESITGRHTVQIKMNNRFSKQSKLNYCSPHVSLPTPVVVVKAGNLQWSQVDGAHRYEVYCNRKKVAITQERHFPILKKGYKEYQIAAVDSAGVSSFLSEPIFVADSYSIYEAEQLNPSSKLKLSGYSGKGFVETDVVKNDTLLFRVDALTSGVRLVDFNYSNGSGPINTSNRCSVRSLYVDGKKGGTIVLPQRGNDEWSNWGFSNIVRVNLTKGTHVFALIYNSENENMDGSVNRAMIDYMRLITE